MSRDCSLFTPLGTNHSELYRIGSTLIRNNLQAFLNKDGNSKQIHVNNFPLTQVFSNYKSFEVVKNKEVKTKINTLRMDRSTIKNFSIRNSYYVINYEYYSDIGQNWKES